RITRAPEPASKEAACTDSDVPPRTRTFALKFIDFKMLHFSDFYNHILSVINISLSSKIQPWACKEFYLDTSPLIILILASIKYFHLSSTVRLILSITWNNKAINWKKPFTPSNFWANHLINFCLR
ncbi:MAG: hypothetical protein ACOCPN_04860, partial [Desulfonatronovibrionaceae bacterium]